ncbi:CyP450 monooxygenase [Pilatotrama ljubarskyi]|nr:CyP450 monooxygenase [Pilatotrama ljubarskyi]
MAQELSIWLVVAATILLVVASNYVRSSNKARLPPGPRPLPIIGNALDIPINDLEQAFREMNARYGDVVYLNALGQPMVILGTHEAAVDLLEKRSSIYSDRNLSTMASLTGWDWVLTVLNYGPRWRRHRRAFHQFFNPAAVLPYRPSQELEAHRFAQRLIDDPKHFLHHVRRLFASTIMRVTYGIEIQEGNDEYLGMAEEALATFNAAFVPGKYLVETFPILRWVPSWMPGARFRREGKAWTPIVHRLRDVPWRRTLALIQEGSAVPSITTELMQRVSHLEGQDAAEEAEVARNVVAVAYAGGADTTLSCIQSFFLAMASYPDVQKKAQAELDAVVGQHRLPDFSDEASLPYVTALIKECLRWRSVVPLGVPHRSIQDDEYRGYFIPKGTLVVSNIWAYSRDPRHYSDPETFMPERFLKDGKLNPDVLDPTEIAFGYGRRICPGRYFAEASLSIIISTVLHTVSINAPLDASGVPVKLEGKMTPGVISYPEPFEVRIKSCGAWAEGLIRESCSMPSTAPLS